MKFKCTALLMVLAGLASGYSGNNNPDYRPYAQFIIPVQQQPEFLGVNSTYTTNSVFEMTGWVTNTYTLASAESVTNIYPALVAADLVTTNTFSVINGETEPFADFEIYARNQSTTSSVYLAGSAIEGVDLYPVPVSDDESYDVDFFDGTVAVGGTIAVPYNWRVYLYSSSGQYTYGGTIYSTHYMGSVVVSATDDIYRLPSSTPIMRFIVLDEGGTPAWDFSNTDADGNGIEDSVEDAIAKDGSVYVYTASSEDPENGALGMSVFDYATGVQSVEYWPNRSEFAGAGCGYNSRSISYSVRLKDASGSYCRDAAGSVLDIAIAPIWHKSAERY